MDYRTYLGSLSAYADSGHNTISSHSNMYMSPDVAKNKMDDSNINVNIVVPETTVNDLNSQAQAQLQVQTQGGSCAPRRVKIPVYQKEDVYKKAVQVREINVKCGTRDVQVGEKIVCINDDGLQVSCEPNVVKEVKYVPVESTKVSHDVIGGKPPCKIVLPPKKSCITPVPSSLRPIKKAIKKRCRSLIWACNKLNLRPSRCNISKKIRLSKSEIESIKQELKDQYIADHGEAIKAEVTKELQDQARASFDQAAYKAQLELEFKDAFLEQIKEEVASDFDVVAYNAELEAEYRQLFQEEFKEDLENKFGIGNDVNIVDGQVLDDAGNVIGTVRLDDDGNFVGISFNDEQ